MVDKISIVVPCYNEEEVVDSFYKEINRVFSDEMKGTHYEIIFVDDGSSDNTFQKIKRIRELDEKVHYVSLSRNFGKESAMYAGLQYADGDYTVIMDADLQHPPKYIPIMYATIKRTNVDMIATRRKQRSNEPRLASFFANTFYRVMNTISGINMGNNAMDYRMLNKRSKDAIVGLREYNRFSKGIFEWIGFKTIWLEIDVNMRVGGVSKWSFTKLLKYAIEGCVAYSTLPLSIASVVGLLFCIIAFGMIVVMVFQSMIWGIKGTGYATIICLMLIIGGIQLFCLGILGQYLAKDYLENKKRPIYLVQESSKEIN